MDEKKTLKVLLLNLCFEIMQIKKLILSKKYQVGKNGAVI